MEEIWKDIEGYETLYKISNLGRVKSFYKDKLLKPSINSQGYYRVNLYKKGIAKQMFIHRLVAMAFIPNPDNKPMINHLDCNPLNCKVDNLEWCTNQENVEYMTKLGRNKRSNEWKLNAREKNKYKKKIVGTNIKNGKKIYFDSIAEAGRNGFSIGDISKCCRNERKSVKGYKFEYA